MENGGVYTIVVSTAVRNAQDSEPVVYEAPLIYSPTEFRVETKTNGSYFLDWNEPEVKPNGPFFYELLVHAGPEMNETTAQLIQIDHPPLIYTNKSAGTFTFSVRIRTKKGFVSPKSECVSRALERLVEKPRGVNLPAIFVFGVLVVACLVAGIAFLVIRNRRLQAQNHFLAFGNSHYNSRSDAATFDDNGLEEEDHPRISGFSDDEPLVRA